MISGSTIYPRFAVILAYFLKTRPRVLSDLRGQVYSAAMVARPKAIWAQNL